MAIKIINLDFTKIAFKPLYTNLFYIVLLSFFLTIGSTKSYSQNLPLKSVENKSKELKESNVKIVSNPSISLDSLKMDTLKPKKEILESKIKRTAIGYEKINQKKKLMTLFDKAELYYQDIELKSGIIVLDYEKNEIYAGRIKDSTGKYTQLPVFKQGVNVIEPDSIRFNFKTKKALVWNSRTEQNDFKIKAEITKRENDSVYFMKRARFTTSEDIENPEYYFQTSKVKFVPGKKSVIGLTHMVIANVPTPLIMPFAFFPMTETSESGIIMPTFNDTRQRGFALQNGGYYFALSDNYDLAILGDYYTNGSYALRAETSYAKRYKYNGNINIRFENLITSERGYPDYTKSNIYNIQWSHNKDQKSNPNSRFSASVNMGSSTYFQQSINQVNNNSRLNNTLSSSVSYSKTFNSVPQVNMSLTATHSQNTQTQTINMTLPSLQLNVDRIFPFAPKDGEKRGIFKNINFQYTLRGDNRIETKDSLFFKPQMFRDANSGFQHSIPLSTNFKLFKYFSASASLNYNEVWYFKTLNKRFDNQQNKVVESFENGFDAFRTYNFSSSIGTTIYGTFNFGSNKKIQSIRHVIRPSVAYSYAPSFEKYYDTYASDGSGTIIKEYTRFERGIYGSPGLGKSNIISFDISNTFEAKVRDKDATKTEPKKIMLLNNLNFHTDYNATSDSLRWSPLRISGGTTLFKNKMNVNFATTLDPYAIDNSGRRINTFNWNNEGSLFRMTSSNLTINYSLASTDGEENKNKQGERNGGRSDDLYGTNTDFSDRRDSQFNQREDSENKISEFFKSTIPWDLTMAYSLTYSNNNRENKIIGNTLSFSTNIELTPKWRIGTSSGYDFVQKGVTYTQFRFERDLLSWRMDFNWLPFGDNAFWGFFIGIKSSVLSDIKWEKRTVPDRQLR
ncbi:MAG: LPS-assembly protein LptD [Flavobacteriaceae bacterium]|nr:LPS-assembly protein LptD [Flavobacteriaceae bacterium]